MAAIRGTPPYEQIVRHYQEAIRSGRLTTGSEILSLPLLAAEWAVSMSTAHKAHRVLRDGGWLRTRAGKPSVVVGVPPEPQP